MASSHLSFSPLEEFWPKRAENGGEQPALRYVCMLKMCILDAGKNSIGVPH